MKAEYVRWPFPLPLPFASHTCSPRPRIKQSLSNVRLVIGVPLAWTRVGLGVGRPLVYLGGGLTG